MAEQANYPGTNNFVTKSFEDRLLDVVEFDDALLDQAIWKNPRYEGCKATSKIVNIYTPTHNNIDTNSTSSGEYMGQYVKALDSDNNPTTVWGGDISYGLNPVVQNETTALYIANTVVGGEEDSQFASIQKHSYLGINKIVIIDTKTQGVQVLERSAEGFEEFHRFITNDLPTGGKFRTKLLDSSIANKLGGDYYVKMNKGWLMNSFDFKFVPSNGDCSLSTNNAMYLYSSGSKQENLVKTGSYTDPEPSYDAQNNDIRFRYAVINLIPGSGQGEGPLFGKEYIGPSFASSSIINNKFTRQFYSGSFGYIQDTFGGDYNDDRMKSSGLGSASRFIGINCLDFLKSNNENTTLTEKDKTEIHVTFFQGTKDFTKGNQFPISAQDERSISTFEIDQNQTSLDIGDHCNDFLPTNHEIRFKGTNDYRFMPLTETFQDGLITAFLEHTASAAYDSENPHIGCTHKTTFPGQFVDLQPGEVATTQGGINVDVLDDMDIWVQGGQLGMYGYQGDLSQSNANYAYSNDPKLWPYDGEATSDSNYQGDFNYQLSFLDKDHTIIADIDKDECLFDGIGNKGLVIIPGHTHIDIVTNIDYYLKKAGLVPNAPPNILPIAHRER